MDFLSSLSSLDAYVRLAAFLAALPDDERPYERRYLCRHDLYYLLRYELHRLDVARPWILDRCREVQDKPNGHIDIWSRDHYKSSLITFGLTVRDILASHGDDPLRAWNGVEPTFAIFSHTRPISKSFLRQIKQELETNESLKVLFPDILWEYPRKQAPKWSEDDGIVVKRRGNPKESTVEAWGLVDGMPTGKHFTVRIYDDVVTEASVTSAEMIHKTTRAWELSLALGTDEGYERYIGTRYDLDDTYQVIMDRHAAIPRIYPATEDGSASGKPVLFSQATWDFRRQNTSPYILSCQMLCDPHKDGTAFFKMIEGVTLKWYDPEYPPQYLRKYATTDGAVTDEAQAGPSTSWTVHLVVGVDPHDNIYLLDLWRAQADVDVWIDAQIDLVFKHKKQIVRWWGESGVIEKAVGPARRKRMDERKCWISYEILPIIGEGDKAARAASFQGRWNQGKIYLPRGATWVSDYLLELRKFPDSLINDQVDASGMIGRALDELYRASIPPSGPGPAFISTPEGRLTTTEAFVKEQLQRLKEKQKGGK